MFCSNYLFIVFWVFHVSLEGSQPLEWETIMHITQTQQKKVTKNENILDG